MINNTVSVCLVSPTPPPRGGIGNWTRLINKNFAGSDRVKIFQVDTSPRWRKITTTSIFLRILGGSIHFVKIYIDFLSKLGSMDCCHLTTSGQLAIVRDSLIILTCKMFKKPLVYHIHFGRIPDIEIRNTFEWMGLCFNLRQATSIIILDYESKKTISKYISLDKVFYLPNAVDVDDIPQPVFERSKSVVFIGWNIPTKGLTELVEGWSLAETDGWNLLIIGPGSLLYRDDLKRKSTKNSVQFLGELSHEKVMEVLASSYLLVLPSYTEALPFVVIEAMSVGTAVLATRVGGIPDIVTSDTGYLIEPKSTDAVAVALTLLLGNVDLLIKLGLNGQRLCRQRHDLESYGRKLFSIWSGGPKLK